jgi:hypothetical protein
MYPALVSCMVEQVDSHIKVYLLRFILPGIIIALKQKVVVGVAQKTSETDNTKFIIDTFLEAAHNNAFHHCWITSETWVELINH